MRKLLVTIVVTLSVLLAAAPADAKPKPPSPITPTTHTTVSKHHPVVYTFTHLMSDHYDHVNTVCLDFTFDHANGLDPGEQMTISFPSVREGSGFPLSYYNTTTDYFRRVCIGRNQHPAEVDSVMDGNELVAVALNFKPRLHRGRPSFIIDSVAMTLYGCWGTC